MELRHRHQAITDDVLSRIEPLMERENAQHYERGLEEGRRRGFIFGIIFGIIVTVTFLIMLQIRV